MSIDPLLATRRHFPILKSTTYLISNSLGAMPATVYRALTKYADMWALRGVRAWSDTWWELAVSAGNVIAPIIGAGRNEISMHTNVSLMQSILISSFDFSGKRNRVVMNDMDFPSVLYAYQKLAVSRGARLTIVRSNDGITVPTERMVRAIDERTLLVPISHVLFRSGYTQDVAAIVEKAHRVGALVVLDAYHSVGVMPVDVKKLGVDVLMGGVLKWLCGGPGCTFLWMRPPLRKKLSPDITGWFAHRDPFSFSAEMEYAGTAFRFLNGTTAVPALYAGLEGPRLIKRLDMKQIRAKSMRQTSLIVDRARELGLSLRSPADPLIRGGAVTLDVPHGFEVSRELLRRNIIVDYRKEAGIRIAPHFYTTDEEMAYALDQIEEILRTRSYRRHTPRKKITVT